MTLLRVTLVALIVGACLWPVAGLAQADPPSNTSPPSIDGAAQQGLTLTYTSGTWSVPSNTTVTSQWERCDATCEDIPGTANQSDYTLQPADVGDTIQVVETATNSNYPDVQVASNLLGPVIAPSTTSLDVRPESPVTDQSVTLFATITSAAGSALPSGSLTFDDNGTPIAGCSGLGVSPAGQSVTVTCQTAFPASTAGVTATFSPAPGTFVTGSASPTATVEIGRAPTSTSLGTPARVDTGSKAMYTATVTPAAGSGGPVQPAGTVTFLDAGGPVYGCANLPVASLRVTCTIKYTRAGRHQIAAVYGGDGNFAGSGSSAGNVTVGPTPPAGYVTSYLSWTFDYGRSSTTVGGLTVSGLVKDTSIAVTCSGRRCAFRRHTALVTAPKRCGRRAKKCSAPKTMNLTSIFRGRHLSVGSKITVRIVHRAWVGKYYEFTIRSGHKPKITESCLAVGATRPGGACT